MSNTNTEILTTAYEKLQGALTQSNTVLPKLEEAVEKGNLDNYATVSQLEEKANEVDLQTQKARIDSFTALAEGSTTGDAELIDARTVNGNTYTNLGGAVRAISSGEALGNRVIEQRHFNKNIFADNSINISNITGSSVGIVFTTEYNNASSISFNFNLEASYFGNIDSLVVGLYLSDTDTGTITSEDTQLVVNTITNLSGKYNVEKTDIESTKSYVKIFVRLNLKSTYNSELIVISNPFVKIDGVGVDVYKSYPWGSNSSDVTYTLNYSIKSMNRLVTSEDLEPIEDIKKSIYGTNNYIKFSGITGLSATPVFVINNTLINSGTFSFYVKDSSKISKIELGIYASDTSSGTIKSYDVKLSGKTYTTFSDKIFLSVNSISTKAYLKIFMKIDITEATEIELTDVNFLIDNTYVGCNTYYQWNATSGTFNTEFLILGKEQIPLERETNNISNRVEVVENKIDDNVIIPTIIEVGEGKQYEHVYEAVTSIATSKANNKATRKNPYIVKIYGGTYELYDKLDLSIIEDQTKYKRGLEIPDNVSLVGIGNVTISCTIPENADSNYVNWISTINTHGQNYFENITFIANNCRYCVHDDGGMMEERSIEFVNCNLKHTGNITGNFGQCYGSGYTGGRKGRFKNCIFESTRIPFYCHTAYAEYMESMKCTLDIESCAMITDYTHSIDLHGPYTGDTNINICSINNCYLTKPIKLRGENVWTVLGGGNSSVTVDNEPNSKVYIAQ